MATQEKDTKVLKLELDNGKTLEFETVNPSAQRSIKGFEPLGNYLLVTVPEEHKTKGSIHIPEGVEASDFQDLNIAVRLGEDVKKIKTGDGVYIGTGSIMTMTFKEGKFGVVRENQLMGRHKD